ncbi:MAG: hypothetical protein K0S36_3 [Nitrosospira multiformis]|jgi:hypothetical protein|nr:hypothetical protein [Nitrosospira multiformis]
MTPRMAVTPQSCLGFIRSVEALDTFSKIMEPVITRPKYRAAGSAPLAGSEQDFNRSRNIDYA